MHLYKYLVLKPLFEFVFGFFTDFSLAPTDEKRIICTLTFIRRVWDLVLKGQFAQIKKKKNIHGDGFGFICPSFEIFIPEISAFTPILSGFEYHFASGFHDEIHS